MNRRFVGVALAVVLALMGTLVLVGWVRAAEDRALADERTVEVLVVKSAVERGTTAEALRSQVEVERVPVKVQAEGSVASLADLRGQVASVDLLPGEQLVASRFIEPKALAAQGDVELPEGLQEVTISLDPQRAVGGKVQPGDTVGVFLSFEPFETYDDTGEVTSKSPNTTHLRFHKVLVTNVQVNDDAAVAAPSGDATAEKKGPEMAPQGSLLVTLAVDSVQAEKVVFTAEFGRVWLSSEPETATEDGTEIQTRGNVYE